MHVAGSTEPLEWFLGIYGTSTRLSDKESYPKTPITLRNGVFIFHLNILNFKFLLIDGEWFSRIQIH